MTSSSGPELATLRGDETPSDSVAAGIVEPPATIGRYRVLGRLGKGGMGLVYACYDVELDREVAIKFLYRERRARTRLLREAQALARVSHPNVVPVFEVGLLEHGGDERVYMTMEMIRGQTLAEWRRRAARSWREVVAVFRDAAAGLVAAHDRGIVHGDFKPDNVLVGEDGRIVVIDFGLARARHNETGSGEDSQLSAAHDALATTASQLAGTPAYMAPEQHLRLVLDERTDQFAFCVALWEALFGERPFAGRSAAELALAITRGEIGEVPTGSHVPRWLADVVRRGLAPDPDRRWPSMRALTTALAPRRRFVIAAVGVGVIASAVLGFVGTSEVQCDDGDRLAPVWSDARAAEVRTAIAAIDAPWSAASADTIAAKLDAYATRWREAMHEACVSTRVRHDADEVVLGHRIDCLADRRRALRAAVDALVVADASVGRRAVDAVSALPAIEPCADVDAPASHLVPPSDPDVLVRLDAVREQLADSSAMRNLGRYETSLELAENATREAAAIGFPPLVARALWLRAQAKETGGDYAGAARDAEDAFHAAIAAGDDDVALRAALAATFASYRLGDSAAARTWARSCASVLARVPTDDHSRARLLEYVAAIDLADGKLDEAAAGYEAAARAYQGIEGPEAVDVGGAFTGIATVHYEQARWKEAIHEYEHALAIREAAYGPDHPEVAFARNNLANTLHEDGRPAEAEPILRRALETLRASLEPDHPVVARVEANYGSLLLELGRIDEGTAALERSFAALERKLGPDHPDMSTAHNMLADADEAAGRFDVAAGRLQRAVELLAGTPPRAAMMEVELGTLLERAGRVDEAQRVLSHALADLERMEAHPIPIALARFAVARTMDPVKREDARVLARRARETLAGAGPPYTAAVHEIDVWLR